MPRSIPPHGSRQTHAPIPHVDCPRLVRHALVFELPVLPSLVPIPRIQIGDPPYPRQLSQLSQHREPVRYPRLVPPRSPGQCQAPPRARAPPPPPRPRAQPTPPPRPRRTDPTAAPDPAPPTPPAPPATAPPPDRHVQPTS